MENKQKSTGKSVAARKMAEKKAEHAKAVKIKEQVFEFEKRNRSKLVIFSSTGEWYKIGGRSALFFYYDVAPRINMSPKLQADRDFYFKFENGIISVKDLKALSVKLSLADIRLTSNSKKEILIFTLPKTYTEDEIARLENIEKVKHDEYNQIVNIKDCRPKYYSELRQLLKKVYEFVRKSDVTVRDTLGKSLIQDISSAMEIYLKYARAEIGKSDFLEQSINRLRDAIDKMTIMMELHISSLDFSIEVARVLSASVSDLEKALVNEKEMSIKQVDDINGDENIKGAYGDAIAHAKSSQK